MTELFYDLLYILPVLVSVAFYAASRFGSGINGIAILGVTMAFAGVFVVLKHWKNRIKYIIPAIIVTILAVPVLIQDSGARAEFIVSNLWVVHCIIIAMISFLSGLLLSGVRMARRIVSAALFTGLILVMVLIKDMPKASVDAALFLLLIIAADEVQYFWKKSGDTDPKKHLVFISPFLLLAAIGVYLIPAPAHPVDYTAVIRFAKKTVSYVKENTLWLHKGEEDYIAYIGFSDDGGFRSGLKKNEKEVMKLTTEAGSDPVVYLNGTVMDTFNGREWSSVYSDENYDHLMDTRELLCAVKQAGEGHEADYIRRNKMSLWYGDFYTKYCFAPGKLIPGDQRISMTTYTEQGGDFISENLLGYGSGYTIFAYRMNRGHELFVTVLEDETNQTPSKETWEAVAAKYMPGMPLPYEDYLTYRDKIYRIYLPETKLSDDTERYLDEILADSESDYESLCRIQNMLASMQYTYIPGKLPESVTTPEEFLDYFLYDKKEGYCTYFATAFVLMARNRGIPARLVQGFRVNNAPGKTVSVRSDMAHSWAEAYIDGVGFMIFDPTPGGMSESFWLSEDERGEYISSGTVYDTPALPEKPLDEDKEPEEKKNGKILTRALLISIPGAILLFILYLLIARMIGSMNYRKKSVSERFLITCRKNFRILGFMGYRLTEGETVEEFRHRVSAKKDAELTEFLKDYEKICYAGMEADEEMLGKTEDNTNLLMAELKKTKGRKLTWMLLKAGF